MVLSPPSSTPTPLVATKGGRHGTWPQCVSSYVKIATSNPVILMFDRHRWVLRRLSSSKGYDVQPWLLIHRKQCVLGYASKLVVIHHLISTVLLGMKGHGMEWDDLYAFPLWYLSSFVGAFFFLAQMSNTKGRKIKQQKGFTFEASYLIMRNIYIPQRQWQWGG